MFYFELFLKFSSIYSPSKNKDENKFIIETESLCKTVNLQLSRLFSNA